MTEQLELVPTDKRKRKSAAEEVCRCGHDVREHTVKGRGCFVCRAECKRFRPKSRKAPVPTGELAAPAGSIVLMRPDTKRPKAMGWAVIEAEKVVVYLDHLKTKSPNVTRRIFGGHFSKSMQMRIMAAIANENKAQCERAMSALEQADQKRPLETPSLLNRGRPISIKVTRISRGRLDDDNLVGALKYIRDGIAEALLVDDKTFSLGKDFFCEQRSAGKAGVFGVLFEIVWPAGGDP